MPPASYRSYYSGFTLIELSIVLVIIGLISAALLTGRDLIAAAQVRQQVAQIDKLNTAVFTFKTKYGHLPGDIPDAIALGLGTAGAAGNGNGNGKLDLNGSYFETYAIWQHLSTAKLINGSFTPGTITDPYFGPRPGIDTPSLALPMHGVNGYTAGGIIVAHDRMISTFAVAPFVQAWLLTTTASDTQDPQGYSGVQAHSLDSKMDDGNPFGGTIRAVINATAGFCASGACYMPLGIPLTRDVTADDHECAQDARTYNIDAQSAGESMCALIIKTPF